MRELLARTLFGREDRGHHRRRRPALQFLLDYAPDLLPGVPVVFCGVSNDALVARVPRSRFTGVRELHRRRTVPRSGAVAAFAATHLRRLGRHADLDTHRHAVEAYGRQQRGMPMIHLDGRELTLEQVLAALRRDTTPRDLLVTTPFTRDHTGQSFIARESLARIAAASAAPTYSPMSIEVGQGLMASGVNAGYEHGLTTARLTTAVLRGRRAGRRADRDLQLGSLPVRLPAARAVRHRRIAAAGRHGDRRPSALVLPREQAADLDGHALHPRADAGHRRLHLERRPAPQGRARAGAHRGGPASVAEDGRHRPARRRHRARLQQPAHRHQRPRRAAARDAGRTDPRATPSVGRRDREGRQPGGGADAAAAGLQPQADAAGARRQPEHDRPRHGVDAAAPDRRAHRADDRAGARPAEPVGRSGPDPAGDPESGGQRARRDARGRAHRASSTRNADGVPARRAARPQPSPCVVADGPRHRRWA